MCDDEKRVNEKEKRSEAEPGYAPILRDKPGESCVDRQHCAKNEDRFFHGVRQLRNDWASISFFQFDKKIIRHRRVMSIALPKPRIGFCAAIRLPLILAAPGFLTACSRNPSVEISGSFFPAWMISILLGVIAAVVAKRIFIRMGIDPHLKPHLFTYGALALSVTLLSWLLFYS